MEYLLDEGHEAIYQRALMFNIEAMPKLSTVVDKKKSAAPRRPRSSSEETRARVLDVARIAYCQSGFDHVGLREIATRAGTDAAIVIRLFGSKEALFQEVAKTAFDLDAAFEGPRETIGEAVADLLLGPDKAQPSEGEFDAFRFLLASASSPAAAPILSANLHEHFVGPLAAHLGGDEAEGRAALVAACVLGLTTMRFALRSPVLHSDQTAALRSPFGAAIQACIDL
jgi:AcrR family transcriptional regulator